MKTKVTNEEVKKWLDSEGIGTGTNITLHMCNCLIRDFANELISKQSENRPSWITEEIENEAKILFSMSKLEGVKYLWQISKRSLNNSTHGLKWCKEYLESISK